MRALRRDVPVLSVDDDLGDALRTLLDSELPALPVVGRNGRFDGVFGEREFLEALFPGYLKQLSSARFLPDSLDAALEQRATCVREKLGNHINREHVDLDSHASDAAIAETFLHHRVLIVPVVDDGQVVGIVRRSEFFRALAERLLEQPGA